MDNINNSKEIKKHLSEIERHVLEVKRLLFAKDEISIRGDELFTSPDGKIIEGIFDGEAMFDQNGNSYPVSPNYASKSQLIQGDKLKLTITPEGRFIYKQIGPANRKRLVGVLERSGNYYNVKIKDKKYRVLLASVTYFKANIGDKITVVVPADEDSEWAAVENVLSANNSGLSTKNSTEESDVLDEEDEE